MLTQERGRGRRKGGGGRDQREEREQAGGDHGEEQVGGMWAGQAASLEEFENMLLGWLCWNGGQGGERGI